MSEDTNDSNTALGQARAQYESIVRMLAAVDVDYDELQEADDALEAARDEVELLQDRALDLNEEVSCLQARINDETFDRAELQEGLQGMLDQLAEVETELARARETLVGAEAEHKELADAADGCSDTDDALQRIYDDPLSVEVRSGWATPGEELVAEEFCILLCTGGPACRIRGDLDENGYPTRAWMEYQDWGTPWMQYFGASGPTLVGYANHFFGG